MSRTAVRLIHSRYATAEDFCAIFDADMNRLYSLALLLTGSHARAEQCFLAALDECRKGPDVFPEWAPSWSRRAVIKQAIRMLAPVPTVRAGETLAAVVADGTDRGSLLLQLPAFERFVFAMSVLEGQSARDCAALLNCRLNDVEKARMQVLQMMAGKGHALAPAEAHGAWRAQLMSEASAG